MLDHDFSEDDSPSLSDDSLPSSGRPSTLVGCMKRRSIAGSPTDQEKDKWMTPVSQSKRTNTRTSHGDGAELGPRGLCSHINKFSGKSGEEDFDV